jgi:thymidylate kinase
MKVIILEGMTTSGKTSVKKCLEKFLTEKNISFSIVEEAETLMPLLKDKSKESSIPFLKKLLRDTLQEKEEIVIFDRLLLSHLFRTKASINEFKEVIDILKPCSFIGVLQIEEDKILSVMVPIAKRALFCTFCSKATFF